MAADTKREGHLLQVAAADISKLREVRFTMTQTELSVMQAAQVPPIAPLTVLAVAVVGLRQLVRQELEQVRQEQVVLAVLATMCQHSSVAQRLAKAVAVAVLEQAWAVLVRVAAQTVALTPSVVPHQQIQAAAVAAEQT
ncbi:MAG: hypothetical protein VKK05_04765 [Synechococcus sp.]|nr:hypothetical protein [Synechococcus sp.]